MSDLIPPTVTMKMLERSLDLMRWGLVPFWAKDLKVGFANINAKAEGIEGKPAFREGCPFDMSGARTGAGSRARRCNCPAAEMAMLDTGLRRFVWRIADGLDYVLTLARLRILDALTGPLPETPEDQQRERRRDRLERAFPKIES